MVAQKLPQIKKAITQYVNALEKMGIHVERVILYGSYAKGHAHSASDIDIIVISRDLAGWPPIERLQMLSRATATIEAPLEVLGYTPQEIKRRGEKSIFWEEITKSGMEVYNRAA